MRGKTIRGAWLVAACLALAPGVVRGQAGPGLQYAPADPQIPVPLGSTRPEDGGPFAFADFVYWRQSNPLREQQVAVFGFRASDNSIQGIRAGTFVGSQLPALDVAELTGQDSYQPGFRVGVGWKFWDDSAITLSYLRLTEASYRAGVTGNNTNRANGVAGPNAFPDPTLASTFLFAPVFNYPPQFNGPPFKVIPVNGLNGREVGLVSSQAVSGIWNGATIMTLQFIQRYQEWDMTYRQVLCETETMRVNALVGPRFVWIWDAFRWNTTAFGTDLAGNLSAGPEDIGVYTTLTSNRMYGLHAGCQYECYIGHGFALTAEGQTAIYANAVHEEARYETAAKFYGFPENKRSKRAWDFVPELQADLGLMWYPWEFIQMSLGYQGMVFFNTRSTKRPIDFDYSNVAPNWVSTTRFFDGFRIGLAIQF
jgi:hypothetical protein